MKKSKLDDKLGRYNVDGFVNAQSGMGIRGLDKQVKTRFEPNLLLDQRTLSNMYRFDWLTRKICDKPAIDATKKFIEIVDDDDEIIKDFAKLKIKQHLKKALSWARLFGGAVIIPVVDDGLDPSEPFDINRVKGVVDVLVFDRYRIQPTGIENNVESPQYLKPEFYQVQSTKWHHSRVFPITGCELTFDDSQSENGWGGSVVDLVQPAINHLESSYADIRHLLNESSIAVTKIPNLSRKGNSGELYDAINARLSVMNSNKSIFRGVALDKEEEFEWINRTFSGVEKILDIFTSQISAASDIPELVLFGKSKGGLSSGQQEELDVYYDLIEGEQEIKLTDTIQRFIDIFSFLRKTESVEWNFKPLQHLNENESADIRLKNAQALALESDVMGLTEDEARDIAQRADNSGLFNELEESLNLGFEDDTI